MQDILSDAATKITRFKEQLASKQGQLNAEAQVRLLQHKKTCRTQRLPLPTGHSVVPSITIYAEITVVIAGTC